MSDLIAVPTVEQINLEHQLANSKANEAVQHATNCGLMLLQVKASKKHGEWLPWLKQQQESVAIGFSHMTATKYMRLAANINRGLYLPETTSIRAALELLSDQEPTEQQGELIDVEAERKARQDAESKAESERQARLTAEQRAQEFGVESNERRKKIRELEEQIGLLGNQAKPEPVIVEKEVIPDDYESAKEQAVKLKDDIKKLREKQDALVQQQVKEKMKEREKELDDLNRQASEAETRLSSLRKHIDSYSSIERMTRLQREQIEKVRSVIAELAANMEGFTRLENDKDTDRLWSALADMLRNGAAAIDFFSGANNSGLSLTA